MQVELYYTFGIKKRTLFRTFVFATRAQALAFSDQMKDVWTVRLCSY